MLIEKKKRLKSTSLYSNGNIKCRLQHLILSSVLILRQSINRFMGKAEKKKKERERILPSTALNIGFFCVVFIILFFLLFFKSVYAI